MQPLSIDAVTIKQCGIKLDFTYSPKEFGGHLTDCHPLLFALHCGDYTGYGECISDGSEWQLALQAGQRLLGVDPRRLDSLLSFLTCSVLSEKRVREGLSIALYDLVGKMSGLPVYTLLGGQRRLVVPGMPVIHVASPEVMARRAAKWVEAGYRYLKLKLQGDPEPDLASVQRVRQEVGYTVEFQLDANRGYEDLAKASAQVQKMEDLRISVVEDLLDAEVEAYCSLRTRISPRIMVDNQGWWPNVHRVVSVGAADIINHHPNNQGGLENALKIDAVATAAGLLTAVGSSGLLGVQNAAFQQLSTVIGLERPCEDIGLLPYYEGPTKGEYKWSANPSIIAEPYPIINGQIHIPDKPGLGIKIDEARLKSLLEREQVLKA